MKQKRFFHSHRPNAAELLSSNPLRAAIHILWSEGDAITIDIQPPSPGITTKLPCINSESGRPQGLNAPFAWRDQGKGRLALRLERPAS
jgi:hypothetical protein